MSAALCPRNSEELYELARQRRERQELQAQKLRLIQLERDLANQAANQTLPPAPGPRPVPPAPAVAESGPSRETDPMTAVLAEEEDSVYERLFRTRIKAQQSPKAAEMRDERTGQRLFQPLINPRKSHADGGRPQSAGHRLYETGRRKKSDRQRRMEQRRKEDMPQPATPRIDANSERLARRMVRPPLHQPKSRAAAPDKPDGRREPVKKVSAKISSFIERQDLAAHEKQGRLRQQREAQLRAEAAQCTFAPELNHSSRQMLSTGLYERAVEKRARQQRKVENGLQNQRDLERKEATFTPRINPQPAKQRAGLRKPLSAIEPAPQTPDSPPRTEWASQAAEFDSPGEWSYECQEEGSSVKSGGVSLSPYCEEDSLEAEVMKMMAEWRTLGL